MNNPFKVGDILCATWRYSMEFPNFYKVVKTTEKTISVVELAKYMVRCTDGGYNQQGYEVPAESVHRGKPRTHIVKFHGDNAYIVTEKSMAMGNAYIWDGTPQYADYCD